jgi:two-component system response regulator NreC
MGIKILLADDHKIIREGLRSMIEKESDMSIVAEAGNGRSAVKLVRELSPDVVVMDISMPDLNGIESTRQILDNNPDIKVVALSMHSDKRYVVNMLKAGAKGYLLKDCAFDELIKAIRTVLAGHICLSPTIDDLVIEDYIQQVARDNSWDHEELSSRELEVIQLLAEGNTTKQIGKELNISIKTVETHRVRIMKKLKINTMADLTKYAIREGMISIES